MGKDYYDILGVSKGADADELKKGRWTHFAVVLSRLPQLRVAATLDTHY